MYSFLAVWKQLHVACMSVVKRYTRLDPLAMQISFVFLRGIRKKATLQTDCSVTELLWGRRKATLDQCRPNNRVTVLFV